MEPAVVLVGRPNVGKSTLFNRLSRQRLAITADQAGVTRDRQFATCHIAERVVLLVDTGGFLSATDDDLLRAALRQTQLAIEEAHLVVLLTDARQGVTPDDFALADLLRRAGKPTIAAVNKVDGGRHENLVFDFYRLGLGDPLGISAEHAYGINELQELIDERLSGLGFEAPRPEDEEEEAGADAQGDEAGAAPPEEPMVRLAIIGRPNVGKSSLVNALVGEERSVVHALPGTTRDSIDSELLHDGRRYLLIDTAGIRRRGKIADAVESFSVMRTVASLSRCDVAAVLLDAVEGLTEQDAHVAGAAWEGGRGVVLVVNKWDLVADKDTHTAGTFAKRLMDELPFLVGAPIVFTSTVTRKNIFRLLRHAAEVRDAGAVRFETSAVNQVLEQAQRDNPAPYRSGGASRGKIFYGAQVGVLPPRFVLFSNVGAGQDLHFSYLRFLENRIRDAFGFQGNPVVVSLRKRTRPPRARSGR